MDGRGVRLARHVAEAADAWLEHPVDTYAYQRFVMAVVAWRQYVRPQLGESDVDDVEPVVTPHESQADELLDELAATIGVPLGELLDGDPATVLERLRSTSQANRDSPPDRV